MNIELVEWIDSAGETGWGRLSAHRLTYMNCQTVGFVVHETDAEVGLMQSHDDQEGDSRGYHNLMVIPKVAITTRRVIGA